MDIRNVSTAIELILRSGHASAESNVLILLSQMRPSGFRLRITGIPMNGPVF